MSKYLVQWDKEENFDRSYAGGDVSHSDASGWSSVVTDTQYQVLQSVEVNLETSCLVRVMISREQLFPGGYSKNVNKLGNEERSNTLVHTNEVRTKG